MVTAERATASPAPGSSTDGSRFFDVVAPCATVGIGGLPHRDAALAAEFSLGAFDVLTLPSLPRLSPAESPIAQVLVGAPGVTLGQYGTFAVDVARLDPDAPVRADVSGYAFTGLRATLELAVARAFQGPVKWQLVGPISVGVTLLRSGAPADLAFALAARLVRSHLRELSAHIARRLPDSPQLVVLDEPLLDGVQQRDFPIAPDIAVDLLSSTMASVAGDASVGIHTCGEVDLATLIATGPDVVSVPVRESIAAEAGYLNRFLGHGGHIAWGAVTTEGPISVTSRRAERRVTEVWNALSARGCDPQMLRSRALISPQCGLGGHSREIAEQVRDVTRAVARAIAEA